MPEVAGLLTPEEVVRYSRHLMLPEVGVAGQEKLKAARVLLVGAGGLGSPLGLYLAAAGIGTLGLVDADRVDATNLQRQVLYTTDDVGRIKVEAAAARLTALNPGVRVETHAARLSSENAFDLLAGYDVVVDGTDNFPTRYLVNDACVMLGKPNVYGSIFRFEGQASVFDAARGPCYRCLYPEPPPPGAVPSCAEGGVLGVLPGVVGMIQAIETVKLVLGQGEPLIGRLLLFDALEMRFRELRVRKASACPVCGPEPTITSLIDYEAFCAGPGAAHEGNGRGRDAVTPRALRAELDQGRPVTLLDVREPFEHALVRLPDAQLVPLGQLPERLDALPPADADIVVYCHHGQRSEMARRFLAQRGFTRVRNLEGGIDRWAADVDPGMRRY